MFTTDLNYLAIGAVMITSMILGALWYSPLMFGKAWMKFVGITSEQAKQENMAKLWLMGLCNTFILTFFLALFLRITKAETLSEMIQVSLFLWLGFIVTTIFGGVIWEKKPVKLFLINAFYFLVSLPLASVIFYFLP